LNIAVNLFVAGCCGGWAGQGGEQRLRSRRRSDALRPVDDLDCACGGAVSPRDGVSVGPQGAALTDPDVDLPSSRFLTTVRTLEKDAAAVSLNQIVVTANRANCSSHVDAETLQRTTNPGNRAPLVFLHQSRLRAIHDPLVIEVVATLDPM
jgi:hypothetical protein